MAVERKRYGRTRRDEYVVVTLERRENDPTGLSDAYSITGEVWDSRGWALRGGPDGRMRACGQITEEIERAFPELRPIMALHLSDLSGTPLHAEANGWYF